MDAWLRHDSFDDDEATFLKRLAAPYWGKDAALVASVWQQLSDAYAEYPLSNDMQYYGPFHAGPAWPLLPDVSLAPLARTWKPHDPPSGDAIGECLENHTIEEASILAQYMAKGARVRTPDGADALEVLASRWNGDFERMRDIGVMRALALQFQSGSDIFDFYRERARALYESRVLGNATAARAAVRRMGEAVAREESVTRALLPLAKADSRLGFHSEAEAHQYHPAKLEWRLGELAKTKARLAEIDAALARGEPYPESEFERAAPVCKLGGEWTDAAGGVRFRARETVGVGLEIELDFRKEMRLRVNTLDAAGVTWYRSIAVDETGARPYEFHNVVTPSHEIAECSAEVADGRAHVRFVLSSAGWGGHGERRRSLHRPEWIQVMNGNTPLWPERQLPSGDWRLNLDPVRGNLFGRLRGWGAACRDAGEAR